MAMPGTPSEQPRQSKVDEPIRIFLNYRRDDAGEGGSGQALTIRQELKRRFGEKNVFWDIASLRPGRRWDEVIDEELERSDAIVVVIGAKWLTVKADGGRRRRLNEPDDRLRREVENALEHDLAVFPVLVAGADMPGRRQLPGKLKELCDFHALELSARSIDSDIEELADSIEGEVLHRGEEARKENAADAAKREAGEHEERQIEKRARVEAEKRGRTEVEGLTPEQSRQMSEADGREAGRRTSVAEPGGSSLSELLEHCTFKYHRDGDRFVIPFQGNRVQTVGVGAWELTSGDAFFVTHLPSPGFFGKETVYRNLLRTSFAANYVKAFAMDDGELALAAEVPVETLTPQIVEGIVGGLATLGDVNRSDLTDSSRWQSRIAECAMAQSTRIALDVEARAEEVLETLTGAGMEVEELGRDAYSTQFDIVGGASLRIAVKLGGQVISLIAYIADANPGSRGYLKSMLERNRAVNVAKFGLDSEGDVALLYEVPRFLPNQLEQAKSQLSMLAFGLAAIDAGELG